MAETKRDAKSREVRYTNEGAELPTFYANNVELMVSTWDMRLRFGQIETANGNELAIKNILTVYLSVEHARVFIQKAQQSLAQWDALQAKASASKAKEP